MQKPYNDAGSWRGKYSLAIEFELVFSVTHNHDLTMGWASPNGTNFPPRDHRESKNEHLVERLSLNKQHSIFYWREE